MDETVHREPMTVAQLRSVLDKVPADAALLVGIWDRHHFAALLGDLPVVGLSVMPCGPARALVFDVDTVS